MKSIKWIEFEMYLIKIEIYTFYAMASRGRFQETGT